ALVRGREERRHHVRSKWVALFWSAVAVFRRFPMLRVLLRLQDASGVPRVTPFVFVGNNRYEMKLLTPKSRSCLDRGELCLCVAEDEAVAEALLEDLAALEPALVIASGDLTQRATRAEFRAARHWLDRIPFPKLVVPGNHDIPLFDLFHRAFKPLTRYRRYIC